MKIIILAFLLFNIPTFHDGLFQVYDNVQVTRIEAMYSELRGGQFPVRYIDSFGHGAGYMLFKYYSPLLYYLGAAFMYLGFSAIKAVKLIYLIATAVGALGCWKWLRERTQGAWPARLGTLAFLSAPYVYHDFFHRGSMTEAAALMLMPWVMWAYGMLKDSPTRRNVAWAAITFGLVILTHSLTGVMTGALIMLYLVIKPPRRRGIMMYLLAVILALGMASFSLVPALLDKHTIQYENNSLLMRGYIDHPIKIAEQLNNQGIGEAKSAYLGLTLIIVYGVLMIIFIMSRKFRDRYAATAIFVLAAATVGLYLISPSSRSIWEQIIYLRYFQFPFRLLTVVTLVLSLGMGVLTDYYQSDKIKLVALGLLVIIPLLYSRSFYRPLGYQYGTTYTADDPCKTTTWADEYLSKWVHQCLLTGQAKMITPSIDQLEILKNGREIKFEAKSAGEYIVAKYYAPEWVAHDTEGNVLETEPVGENGLIQVKTDRDTTVVILTMKPSRASRWGDAISLGSLFLVIALLATKSHPESKLKPVKQRSSRHAGKAYPATTLFPQRRDSGRRQ